MEELYAALHKIEQAQPLRVTLGAPRSAAWRRAFVTPAGGGWQVERLSPTQAFHENVPAGGLAAALAALMEDFDALTAFTAAHEHSLRRTAKGRLLQNTRRAAAAAPPRERSRALPEGVPIPPLADMGVLTREGEVVAAKRDKYRQICRFLELVGDALDKTKPERLNVVDFGCGKSALTFVLYHYLTEVRGVDARVTGVDRRPDVVAACRAAARRYGWDNIGFEAGDIAGYAAKGPVDMVVALHACDTATDEALARAVEWNAPMIFSVPCCQHELNGQMRSEELAILTRYGIVRERVAALMTDALRANLLAACGYRVQLVEFVGFEHTPKNIMIRAVRANTPPAARKKALAEAQSLMSAFGLRPALWELLQGRMPCSN